MNAIRCGRCIAGEHDQCVVSIRMGAPKSLYTWHCDCGCQSTSGRKPVTGLKLDDWLR